MEDKSQMNELFARYLNNECSEKELAILLKYFGSEKNEDAIRELVRRQLEVSFYDDGDLPVIAGDVLKKSYLNIADKTYLKNKNWGRIIRLDRRSHVIRFTACASVIVLIALLYFGKQHLYAPPQADYKQAITRKGERRQFNLTDGTKIWLAPGSVLNYPGTFNGKTREVTLNGEAFFEVAHDAGHPFIIYAGKLKTTVLGTVFNVKAYTGRTAIEVTLLSGKVGVSGPGKQMLLLMPDQRAVLNNVNDSLYKEDYPAARDLFARRNGRFIYKGMALTEVLNDISDVYNVTILAAKEIQALKYYGEFDQKEDLQSVLMQITLTSGLKLKTRGSTFTLYK